jgi:ABC-type nickel/cobalt efflux system permease component RcnA
MSVSIGAGSAGASGRVNRIAIAITAVVVVLAALLALAWAVSAYAPQPPPRPARNPFGVGAPGATAAPATSLAAWLIAVQSDFFRSLSAALRDGAGAVLMQISFAYGVFHAAGPGHGKAVIAGYVVASPRALRLGIALSFAAAALQAVAAIVLVAVLAAIVGATAAQMSRAEYWVEMASYAAVALLGAALLWRKAGRLAMLLGTQRAVVPGGDGHWHLPDAEAMDRTVSWREFATVAFAAGIRPCSGAIVILVFALSQGLIVAGVGAVAAMALGTALTTSALAVLAVFAKRAALALASGRGTTSLTLGAGLETLAAAFILIMGVGLMTSYWFAIGYAQR